MFYFHPRDKRDTSHPEGKQFPDRDAARQHAIETAQSLNVLAEHADGRRPPPYRIDIEDARGRIVDTVWLRDVVEAES